MNDDISVLSLMEKANEVNEYISIVSLMEITDTITENLNRIDLQDPLAKSIEIDKRIYASYLILSDTLNIESGSILVAPNPIITKSQIINQLHTISDLLDNYEVRNQPNPFLVNIHQSLQEIAQLPYLSEEVRVYLTIPRLNEYMVEIASVLMDE